MEYLNLIKLILLPISCATILCLILYQVELLNGVTSTITVIMLAVVLNLQLNSLSKKN